MGDQELENLKDEIQVLIISLEQELISIQDEIQVIDDIAKRVESQQDLKIPEKTDGNKAQKKSYPWCPCGRRPPKDAVEDDEQNTHEPEKPSQKESAIEAETQEAEFRKAIDEGIVRRRMAKSLSAPTQNPVEALHSYPSLPVV